ncbi:hypothetical protein O0L34_g8804 [Tuta absoluta]|nr:hypothetical protein O0L34_g8804 [Tuta absoluta]
MSVCAGCDKPLTRKFLKCAICSAEYDLECANMTIKLFNLMQRKEEWVCPAYNCQRRTENIEQHAGKTGPKNNDDETYVQNIINSQEHNNVNTKKRSTCGPSDDESDLSKENNVIDNEDNPIVTELKAYMTQLFQDQTKTLRETIKDLSDTIKVQNDHIENLEKRIVTLENAADLKRRDFALLENTLSSLQMDLADKDQGLLVNDLEIAGCPEMPNENCTHLVLHIAKKIGVDLDEKDVVCVDRAGPTRPAEEDGTPPRPRPIVVRLTRRVLKETLLKAARVRRGLTTEGLGLPEPARKLYINERLTKCMRLLFQQTRRLKVDHNFQYVWTTGGKIFVRQEQGKPRHRIRGEGDLQKVFGIPKV